MKPYKTHITLSISIFLLTVATSYSQTNLTSINQIKVGQKMPTQIDIGGFTEEKSDGNFCRIFSIEYKYDFNYGTGGGGAELGEVIGIHFNDSNIVVGIIKIVLRMNNNDALNVYNIRFNDFSKTQSYFKRDLLYNTNGLLNDIPYFMYSFYDNIYGNTLFRTTGKIESTIIEETYIPNSSYKPKFENSVGKEKAKEIAIVVEEKQKNEKIVNEKYAKLILQGDSAFQIKSYSYAQQQYSSAFELKSFEKYPSNQIEEIKTILTYLKDRKTKVYNYKEVYLIEYNAMYDSLQKNIQKQLTLLNCICTAKVQVILKVDSLANFEMKISNPSNTNNEITSIIQDFINKYKLKKIPKNNYLVNAIGTFDIDVKLDKQVFSLKKNNVGTKIKEHENVPYKEDIDNLINGTPIGKYKVSLYKRTLNNISFSNNKIINYKSTGGPSNMFLSMLVPGLGVKAVSGGSISGLPRTILTYGLIGIGVGFKFWSNFQYDKYHNASSQTEMDSYFKKANNFNKAFYYISDAAAIIWLCDIIWVAKKGFENQKNQKKYKETLSLNYDTEFKNIGLTYLIKF